LVPFDKNSNDFSAGQVNELLNNRELPFKEELTVNTLDSKYSSPEYIAKTHHQPNLVNIIRLASNRNVWKKLSEGEQKQRRESNLDNRGADAIYGQQYKLSQVSDWDLTPDIKQEFGIKLSNGRSCIVKMEIWDDMLIRSKRGISMKKKAFRLARVELRDPQSGEPLFKRAMWLGIWGDRRKELEPDEIYWAYRNRFDLEHFFRFGKQRLLLEKFQTPDPGHWQNWLEVVSLAYWLLWVASEEAEHKAKKWQQYSKTFKNRKKFGLKVSPSQVQNQLEAIILSFEQSPFLPKLKIKGRGRKIGTKFPKRTQHPVRKKPSTKRKRPP